MKGRMKVWNVELGLAVHIQAPNGKYVVIDLGSTADVSPISYLQNEKVAYMVITHPHHDHFSDIQHLGKARPEVLWRVKSFTDNELMEGVLEKDRADFEAYIKFCNSYTGNLTAEEEPNTGNPLGGMKAQVFQTRLCEKNNINNFSGIVVLTMGRAKIVVCGDNEKPSIDKIMISDDFREAVKNAWIFVAPHHGRDNAYSDEFVDLVKPLITIVSDTTKGETSVAEKYGRKSKGYEVINNSTKKIERRECLTTRKDGNIVIDFGDASLSAPNGTMIVYTHC